MAVGDRICIYDLGGGTFDVCVLVKTDEGFEILGKPTGIPFLGGADFDQLIISAVVEGLSALNCDVDPDDPGIAALRRECVDAKEALSADVEAVIPVRLQGVSTTYRITRSEFEAMIDAAIELTIEATGHALRSAGIAAGDLAAIVLVGGSSRIPLVSQKLEHAFKCRIAVNTHPKHEVALGAALAGSQGADREPVVVPIAPRAPHRRRQAVLSISSCGGRSGVVGHDHRSLVALAIRRRRAEPTGACCCTVRRIVIRLGRGHIAAIGDGDHNSIRHPQQSGRVHPPAGAEPTGAGGNHGVRAFGDHNRAGLIR